MKSFGLGKSCRLNLDRPVQDILKNGRRAVQGPLIVYWDSKAAMAQQQLAIRISSKLAPAVARNRVKRLLREIFRQHRHLWITGLRMVIVVREYRAQDWKKISAMEATLQQICAQKGIAIS